MSEPTREQIKEAFKKTIERWERIMEDVDYFGETECSLCLLEGTDDDYVCTEFCPIRLNTNQASCHGTPYGKFFHDKTPANALAELNFLRKVYIWWMEKEKPTGVVRKEKEERCGNCEDFMPTENKDYGHCADATKSQEIKWHPSDNCSRWRMKKKKEEWKDITSQILWNVRADVGGEFCVLLMSDKDGLLGHMFADGEFFFARGEYKVEHEIQGKYFRILIKI